MSIKCIPHHIPLSDSINGVNLGIFIGIFTGVPYFRSKTCIVGTRLPTINVLSNDFKNIQIFSYDFFFIFTAEKISVYYTGKFCNVILVVSLSSRNSLCLCL